MKTQILKLPTDDNYIEGNLGIPEGANSIIIFLSGSDNDSNSFNRRLAGYFEKTGFATLLFDLITKKEKVLSKKLDVRILKRRIITITTWLKNHSKYHSLDLGFIGINKGVAPAIMAAAELGSNIKALVLIGGQADLAKKHIPQITSPTLLVVPEYDFHAINLNSKVFDLLVSRKNMIVVPGASHFFEEPHKLEQLANASISWFEKYLKQRLSQTSDYQEANEQTDNETQDRPI